MGAITLLHVAKPGQSSLPAQAAAASPPRLPQAWREAAAGDLAHLPEADKSTFGLGWWQQLVTKHLWGYCMLKASGLCACKLQGALQELLLHGVGLPAVHPAPMRAAFCRTSYRSGLPHVCGIVVYRSGTFLRCMQVISEHPDFAAANQPARLYLRGKKLPLIVGLAVVLGIEFYGVWYQINMLAGSTVVE